MKTLGDLPPGLFEEQTRGFYVGKVGAGESFDSRRSESRPAPAGSLPLFLARIPDVRGRQGRRHSFQGMLAAVVRALPTGRACVGRWALTNLGMRMWAHGNIASMFYFLCGVLDGDRPIFPVFTRYSSRRLVKPEKSCKLPENTGKSATSCFGRIGSTTPRVTGPRVTTPRITGPRVTGLGLYRPTRDPRRSSATARLPDKWRQSVGGSSLAAEAPAVSRGAVAVGKVRRQRGGLTASP